MRHVTTKSHYDIPILLDQCEVCGGIWVDAHELYKVSYKEIDQLKELDSEIQNDIKKDVPIKKNLKCPTDGTLLVQPSKSLFPTDSGIVVEMCPTCRSVWFNYGELTSHQLHRANFNRQSKEAPTEKEAGAINTARKLLGAERSKTTANIRRFGKFLSTPVKGGIPLPLSVPVPFSPQGALIALLLTLSDMIQEPIKQKPKLTFADMFKKHRKQPPISPFNASDKLPESIIPTMQKYFPSMDNKDSYDFSEIHKLNDEHKRKKGKFIYIIFLLLVFLT